MGAVYEAQHTLVKRRFAVKFLHPELARKRELLARFQREAEAAGALESENVAASVDLGIASDGSPYIVMEYLVGESLEMLLEREGTLPFERAADIVQQASRGVQAAHALGIVHRDLKPHNLFVCRRENGTDLVKVLDFGIAKLEVVEPTNAATRTGTILGTPSYMSPEQARGEKSVGHAADVYALGAIAYELLSGKKPHPGDSHNAILHHIATQPAVSLATVTEGLPEGLVAAVEQALAPKSDDRPATADAFARALAPWVARKSWPSPKPDTSAPKHEEPSSTVLAPAGLEHLSPVASLAVASLDGARLATPAARPPRLFVLLGAVAALLALVLFLVTPRSEPRGVGPAPPPPVPTLETDVARAPPEAKAAATASTHEPPQPAALTALSTPPAPPPSRPEKGRSQSDAPKRPLATPLKPAPPREALQAPLAAKSAPPAAGVAAPVTFDPNNPYH
jgi:serine/threonine-protein kinase